MSSGRWRRLIGELVSCRDVIEGIVGDARARIDDLTRTRFVENAHA